MENIIQVNSDPEYNKAENRGWYDRMKDEQKELNERILKLEKFMNSDTYHELCFRDQLLIVHQSNAMNEYNTILLKRIYGNAPN